MTILFKENNRYIHGMLHRIMSIFFETVPTKHTWSVNILMTNTKLTSLRNIVDVSLYSYYMQAMKTF